MAKGWSWQLRAYLAFSRISGPLWRYALKRRAKAGKESPDRLTERLGVTTRPRPEGAVIWFHALSVGESLALLQLFDHVLELRPDTTILLTTATRTSAEALAKQNLPERVIHQMLPIDVAGPVASFLDHWRPDAAIFSELDFWPAIMAETHRRGIPMALINSRMSDKNFDKRKSGAALFGDLLGMFEVKLVQDDATRDRFAYFGCDPATVHVLGALKGAPRPLPADPEDLEHLARAIGERPVWLAASTEAREHRLVAEITPTLCRRYADMLLILAPRHPKEADGIESMLKELGLETARRSRNEPVTEHTKVLLADTIGEMGLWYRLAPVTFMGHSLDVDGTPLRGKNPFEAAVLGTALIHGHNVIDFEETYAAFDAAGGAICLTSNGALLDAVLSLFTAEVADPQRAAADGVLADAARVLDDTYQAISPILPES